MGTNSKTLAGSDWLVNLSVVTIGVFVMVFKLIKTSFGFCFGQNVSCNA